MYLMYIDPTLNKEVFGWRSPNLGLEMPIVRYGHFGHALLLFPTAQSDLYDAERFYLIKAVEHHLLNGRVSIFAINTINDLSWMNRDIGPKEKARRQQLYAKYIEDEVVPHIRRVLGDENARIGVTGASFGAYHAANAFFRRPDMFDTLIAMSGFYELWPSWLHGYTDDNVYFNNPMWYVRNIHDARTRDLIRHSQVHILTGQGQWEHPQQSKDFSSVLWESKIWNNLDLWGHDTPHDWPTWRKMLNYYVGERLGW